MNAFGKLRQAAIEVAACLRHLLAVRTPLMFSTALWQPLARQLFTEPDCSSQGSQEHASHPHLQPYQSLSHFCSISITAMLTAGRATWLWAGRSGVLLHGGIWDFCHFQNVLHAVRTSQPPVQWVLGLFAGVRRPGRHVNHWPSSSAKVKNKWAYTNTPLYPFMTCTGTTLSLPLHFPHTMVPCFKFYWPTLILHVFLLLPHVLHALPISFFLTW